MNNNDQGKRDPRQIKVHLFYQPQLTTGIHFLDGDEGNHAKVLRVSIGDSISVTDGKGANVEAIITDIEKQTIHFTPKQPISNIQQRISIHLFVAPTKNPDRIEWLVEKATEIGIASITLIECTRSERRKINHDRLLKVAVAAMKQSQQAWLPEIKPITALSDIVEARFDQNFIAFVDHTNPDHLRNLAKPGMSYGLLIGPEGDFTDEEIDLAINSGWKKVSLGPNRLRTETAALVGALTLVLVNS